MRASVIVKLLGSLHEFIVCLSASFLSREVVLSKWTDCMLLQSFDFDAKSKVGYKYQFSILNLGIYWDFSWSARWSRQGTFRSWEQNNLRDQPINSFLRNYNPSTATYLPIEYPRQELWLDSRQLLSHWSSAKWYSVDESTIPLSKNRIARTSSIFHFESGDAALWSCAIK